MAWSSRYHRLGDLRAKIAHVGGLLSLGADGFDRAVWLELVGHCSSVYGNYQLPLIRGPVQRLWIMADRDFSGSG